MKTTQITLITLSIVFSAACSASKKSTASTTATPVSTTTSTTPATSLLFIKSPDGVYPPGNEELTAIQLQYKDVTLDKLKEGHAIYTQGACVKCHGADNIYRYGEAQWKDIIDTMAQKAGISDAEKDAVYKYVLAIKATQPK